MGQEIEAANERHPFRFLIKFVVFVGLLALAAKLLNDKKSEYSNLTESQARDKFVDTVGPRVGDDTANEIADQVIPKLKERGLVKPDPVEEAAREAKEAADELKDKAEDLKDSAEEASDQVSDAVDSVVKD